MVGAGAARFSSSGNMGFAYSFTDFSPPSKLSLLSCFFFDGFLPLFFLSFVSLYVLFTPSANFLFTLSPSSSLTPSFFFSCFLSFCSSALSFAFPSSYFGLANPLPPAAPSSFNIFNSIDSFYSYGT
jgi:hypothetical protein